MGEATKEKPVVRHKKVISRVDLKPSSGFWRAMDLAMGKEVFAPRRKTHRGVERTPTAEYRREKTPVTDVYARFETPPPRPRPRPPKRVAKARGRRVECRQRPTPVAPKKLSPVNSLNGVLLLAAVAVLAFPYVRDALNAAPNLRNAPAPVASASQDVVAPVRRSVVAPSPASVASSAPSPVAPAAPVESAEEPESTRSTSAVDEEIDALLEDAPSPAPSRPRLDTRDVVAAVKAQGRAVLPCLHQAKARGELTRGEHRMILHWFIKPNGQVVRPQMVGPAEYLGTSLPACFARAMTGWSFPASEGGMEIKNFPFGPITVH